MQKKSAILIDVEYIHEKVHVRQYLGDRLFQFKYAASRKARLNYEIEAYAEQIEFLIQHHPGEEKSIVQTKGEEFIIR